VCNNIPPSAPSADVPLGRGNVLAPKMHGYMYNGSTGKEFPSSLSAEIIPPSKGDVTPVTGGCPGGMSMPF
jgi:hypothetical protein